MAFAGTLRSRDLRCEVEQEPGQELLRRSLAAVAIGLVVLGGAALVIARRLPGPTETGTVALIGATLVLTVAFAAFNARYPEKYRPALWALAPLAPIAAIVATAGASLYLVAPNGQVEPAALAVGTLAGVALWVLGSAAVRELSRADVAASRAFEQIELRQRQLHERVEAVGARDEATSSTAGQAALDEARAQLA